MLSIYSSAFNVIKNNFDWRAALDNFSLFADEVVIAINTSTDKTKENFQEYILNKNYSNIKLISTDFSYKDIYFDGKIKNAALQETKNSIKIGLDLDERIPLRHKNRWKSLGQELLRSPYDGLLIPMVNLWSGEKFIRKDQFPICKRKWYMHKAGLFRGTVNYAKLSNGKIDTDKSDTCELLKENGVLADARNSPELNPADSDYYNFLENSGLFVFHTGYIDFKNTVEKNKKFWKPHWELRGGKPYNLLPTRIEEMTKFQIIKHGLKLWNTP